MKTSGTAKKVLASISVSLAAATFLGCASCSWGVEPVNYTPVEREDWVVSTPEAEGIEPELIDRLYRDASGAATSRRCMPGPHGPMSAE